MKAGLQERYLCEAGCERAEHPPAGPRQQVVPDKWLKGLMLAAASCVIVGLVAALTDNYGPRATTARMERIIAQLDRMNAVRPETARAIARIMSQPAYDCEQVTCDLTSKARNMAVRFRLETLLAEKASAGGVEFASSAKPVGGIASSRAE